MPLVVCPCDVTIRQFCFSQNLSSCSLSQTACFSIYITYFAFTLLNSTSSTFEGMLHPPEPSLAQFIVSPASSIKTLPATEPILFALTLSCSLEQSVISSKSSIALSLSTWSSTIFTLELGSVLLA